MSLPAEITWRRGDLGGLLQAVARLSKLDVQSAELPNPGSNFETWDFETWIHTTCAHLGVEAERSSIQFGDDRSLTVAAPKAKGRGSMDVRHKIRNAAPAILETAGGYVGIVRGTREKLTVVAQDLSLKTISLRDLDLELRGPVETTERKRMEAMVAGCGLESGADTIDALLSETLREVETGTLWQLRTLPGAGIWRQLRENGLVKRIALLITAHAIEYALWIAAWWVIGKGVLEGRIDRGWLAAWILVLITIVPFRMISTWNSGCLAVACGGLLRQRLLAGILQLDPAETRTQGAGRLLGQTFEAEAVESLALSGGIGSLLALVEICVVILVMLQGAGGVLQVAVFAATLAVGGLVAHRYYRRRREWTEQRLALTHDLVEKMMGHRTRAVQQPSEEWHVGEDQALDGYVAASRRMDDVSARLSSLLPRCWLLVGIAALAPALLHSASPASGSGKIAIAIGAILLAYRAIARLSAGAIQLSGAWIAWARVSQLFRAASRQEQPPSFVIPRSNNSILEARQIAFAHAGRVEVFKNVHCTINDGDWILLEGPSGGGKSSLASVLAGVREPSSGLLLASGLDRRTLGSCAWRKMVAAAPQYHENHVFSGTIAFNLLLGRGWPHTQRDLQDASDVCAELGLDDLLRRMPGGMQQMVGETGWQLSQGERSRLFLARALLQNSRMVILDESFAALDPENLRQALECALRRSEALMVVAHP
jgi:ATP-binding cassette, subfamily B, bacterial